MSALLFDTSVYIPILRDENFARAFRPRYLRGLPLTYCSSVVIEEILAGVRTLRHRRQAAVSYAYRQCGMTSLANRSIERLIMA